MIKKIGQLICWVFVVLVLAGAGFFSVGLYNLISSISDQELIVQESEDKGDEKPDSRGKTVIVSKDSLESKKVIMAEKLAVIYPVGFDENQQAKNQTCQILVKGKF